MGLESLEFKVRDDWKKVAEENPWLAFVPELAQDETGQEFMRKPGNSIVYKVSKDEKGKFSYNCVSCEGVIMSATVAHSIHDGPFPLSGSGRCEYEEVPYCQNCEEKPNYHGSPITIPFSR